MTTYRDQDWQRVAEERQRRIEELERSAEWRPRSGRYMAGMLTLITCSSAAWACWLGAPALVGSMTSGLLFLAWLAWRGDRPKPVPKRYSDDWWEARWKDRRPRAPKPSFPPTTTKPRQAPAPTKGPAPFPRPSAAGQRLADQLATMERHDTPLPWMPPPQSGASR